MPTMSKKQMPIKSQKQNRLFQAAAHDPKVAKSTGVPQSVAKKFVSETHGKKVGKLPEKVKGKK